MTPTCERFIEFSVFRNRIFLDGTMGGGSSFRLRRRGEHPCQNVLKRYVSQRRLLFVRPWRGGGVRFPRRRGRLGGVENRLRGVEAGDSKQPAQHPVGLVDLFQVFLGMRLLLRVVLETVRMAFLYKGAIRMLQVRTRAGRVDSDDFKCLLNIH